jgi:hypothetical protein
MKYFRSNDRNQKIKATHWSGPFSRSCGWRLPPSCLGPFPAIQYLHLPFLSCLLFEFARKESPNQQVSEGKIENIFAREFLPNAFHFAADSIQPLQFQFLDAMNGAIKIPQKPKMQIYALKEIQYSRSTFAKYPSSTALAAEKSSNFRQVRRIFAPHPKA